MVRENLTPNLAGSSMRERPLTQHSRCHCSRAQDSDPTEDEASFAMIVVWGDHRQNDCGRGQCYRYLIACLHGFGARRAACSRCRWVADGTLYYSDSYSRVFAIDGATGQVKWSYIPKLDEELVAAQTHSPYNRGIALGRKARTLGNRRRPASLLLPATRLIIRAFSRGPSWFNVRTRKRRHHSKPDPRLDPTRLH